MEEPRTSQSKKRVMENQNGPAKKKQKVSSAADDSAAVAETETTIKLPEPELAMEKPRTSQSKKRAKNGPAKKKQKVSSAADDSPAVAETETTIKLPEQLLATFIKPVGSLLISGMVSWDQVAKRDNKEGNHTHPNLYIFHRFTNTRYRFVASCCSAGHSVLIGENGEAYTFGRNTNGQLGLGDTVTRNTPTPVPALEGKNCIHAAVGKHHTLFLTDTGTVYACGDNKSGQCGIGTTNTTQILTPKMIRYDGPPIVKVGCGGDFSMILDFNGNLHSFGLPEYGQLGHNTDGKYFVNSTKLSFHFVTAPKQIVMFHEKDRQGIVSAVKNVQIVDFSCGTNHTVAIDVRKRAFSWGFGGFGRLGHAEPRDEAVPRLIKFFEAHSHGVRTVYCGSTYSLAVNEIGFLFLFGQTKRTGEANMYPKPVHDLTGWSIRCVGTSNTSIMIAADDSLIAWGVSPTYGELGTGQIIKSTARPRKVISMEGIPITQIAMGFSHTLLLCDDSTEQVKKNLASLPLFVP